MNRAELERRTKIITVMLAVWNCSGNEDMITSYVAVTKDIPVDLLDKACRKLCMESENRPVPATILKAAQNLKGEATGTSVLPWAEAQREIQKGITMTWFHGCLGEQVPDELYGKSCEPKWSTPEIRMAVDAYGLDNLCRAMESDMPIVWAQIRKIYEQICEHRREKVINDYVLGDSTFKTITDGVMKKIGMP